MTDRITLASALERYRAVVGLPRNAYDWYRRDAQRSGKVSLGASSVPAVKAAGRWLVTVTDLDAAIAAGTEARRQIERVTVDYRAHILHGADGETVHFGDGGYRRRRGFHFSWSDYERGRWKSDGTWMCSTCWKPAGLEHGGEECGTCANGWGSCRSDCTLTRVFCEACGTELVV